MVAAWAHGSTGRIPAALWAACQPLLPPEQPPGTPGRPGVPFRRGILHVLRPGGQWQAVLAACGSGSTGHRRCQQWVADGTWTRRWADQLGRAPPARARGAR
ncbi:MAG TPA: transposase [Thermomicrobiales bacterium]|nr:transposase [Thermomicrobiales bacterium]